MNSIVLRSPAKLNLFLKVKHKRKDGYHELVTLFERINLFDELQLTANKSGRITLSCSHKEVPKGPRNLAYRAAQLLKDEFALAQGVHIHIKKTIPVAAGLGGGSSNAATVLRGLNRLWRLSLNNARLVSYAKRLGSDVPFFVYDCSWGFGRGRGDVIRPLAIKAKIDHILIVPRMKVYSRQVFRTLNLQLTKQNDDVNILNRVLRRRNLSLLGRTLANDLETTIIRCHPNLRTVKERLTALPTEGVIFSGSGPAIFGLVRSQKIARSLQNILYKYYKQVYAVRTL